MSALRKSSDVLSLPTLPESAVPGSALVANAVKAVIAIMLVLVVAGIGAASIISVRLTLDGPGELEPLRVSTIRSPETAVVSRVAVAAGDRVKEGQLLVRFENPSLSARLEQLRSEARQRSLELELAVAAHPVRQQQERERLNRANTDVIRARAMLRDRMMAFRLGSAVDSLLTTYSPGSHVAMDLAVGELRSAEATKREVLLAAVLVDQTAMDMQRRRAALDQVHAATIDVERQLRELDVRSPADGVVLGERLETLVGTVALPGETLMEVVDPAHWRATIWLSERYVHEVRVGDSVIIDVPALRARAMDELRGIVASIAPEPGAARDAAAPGQYRTTVALNVSTVSNADIDLLRKGYTVRGRIITRRVRLAHMLRDRVLGRSKAR